MKKELRILIERNSSALENSEMDFQSIYNIIFSNGSNVLAEANDGFRTKRYTYDQIRKTIEEVSSRLYSRIGATHGYVGIEMENSVNWIVSFWSVLRSGNRPYLINCRHPKNLADNIIKNLDIQYIIADKEGELSAKYIEFSSLEHGDTVDLPSCFENEIAISTSATTLKEVVCFYSGREISHQILCARSIVKECPRIADHYKGSLKQLAFLPFYHIFGLVAVYFWFTFYGRTFVFLRDYSPDTILKTVKRHQVTHIFAVPMLWHTVEKQLMKKVAKSGEKKETKFKKAIKLTTSLQNVFPRFGAYLSKRILSEVTENIFGNSVLFCISGGSYLRPSAQYVFNALGYPMYNGYGMSEIGITSVELRKRPKDRNENSIGHPVKSVDYRIGEDGTLFVCGDSVCKKMMINGKVIENDGWFATGDIMEEENGYYYIKGRKGDCVIGENGENVNPDTVEERFTLADANSFSVIGLGEASKEKLTLIVSISPYLSAERIEALKKESYKANDSLPTTMQIKEFYFTTDPLSPPTAVKVGRAYLKRSISEGKVSLTPFSEMKTKEGSSHLSTLEEKVRTIVCQTLDVPTEKVGPDTHIVTELEATSLQYFSILSALAEEFGITEYTEKENYRYTVREISQYISNNV